MSSNSRFIDWSSTLINIDDISFVIFDSPDNDESCGTVNVHFKSGNKYKFEVSGYDEYEDFKSRVLNKDG